MSGIPAGAGQLLGKRLGKFEILALLALGGTAEIYLARIGGAAGFEKYVVVKCLHDHLADDTEFVKMFLDEARLAAHLDHSNIVQTMELGQHDGRYYMVMEFLAGLSLAMIVRRATERLPHGRIPVPLVLNMLAQSCAGLHYAHEKAMNGKALNIVHRDISPQNLVISFEGVVKVVDFGIAKAELRETHTRSGTIKGKFAYMSPEQCVANNVDRRTDVFALGVIGHELLTGRRLFKRTSPYETYQAVIECDAKPPSTLEAGIDPALDPVIMRALAKDKESRYPTAEAFGDALLGYLHHRGIGSGPGDVSRFFDASFGQEIEEHSGRMRELISGRDISVETGVNWHGGEPDEEAKNEAEQDAKAAGRDSKPRGKPGGKPDAKQAAARARPGDPPASHAPIEDPQRASAGSLSMLISDLDGGGSRVGDDDEMPAERTRIESNPLERVNELERLVARTPPPGAGPSRLPNPAGASAGAGTPAPASRPPGMPPSGRFPDLANLPTMIAGGDPVDSAADAGGVPPAVAGFGDAPTALAADVVPPAVAGFGNAPTDMLPGTLPQHARTQIASMPPGRPGPVPYPQHPAGPPGPPGYPVMNAQLSAQIATGASVFPSETRGGPGPGAAYLPPPPGPQGVDPNSYPNGYPSGYPPMPRMPDGGPGPGMPRDHNGNPIDPQRAANMMSPVGQQYPDRDWTAAAAARVRILPPWLLAVLFVGALGGALLLTIVIARLVR